MDNRNWIAFTLICLFSPSALGAVIFVDNRLSADCVGTYSIANRDCSGSDGRAYDTPQEAAAAAKAGDTVYIRAGTYNQTARILFNAKAGTGPTAKITIQNYNSEAVTIDGTSVAATSYRGLITITSSQYIVVKGLHLTQYAVNGVSFDYSNYGEVNDVTVDHMGTNGVYVLRSSHCLVTDVISTSNTWHGIYGQQADYMTVRNCQSYGNTQHGIYVRGGSHCMVSDNEVYSNYVGIFVRYEDSPRIIATYNDIVNNLVYNNANVPENADGISVSSGTQYSTVRNNVCFGNADDGIDASTGSGAGGETANWYCTITGNISFKNGAGAGGDGNGFKVSTNSGGGHIIGNNISFDNKTGGYNQNKVAGYPPNCFYNNIAYHNGQDALHGSYSGFVNDNQTIPNNEDAIFYGNISTANAYRDLFRHTDAEIHDSDYNFWGDGRFVSGKDSHSLSGDPLFSNPGLVVDATFTPGWTLKEKLEYIRHQVQTKFSLRPGSPAIDAGTMIAGYHNSSPGDTAGELMVWYGTAPDVGAYEVVPNGITSLSVSSVSQNSVALAWTVRGGSKPARHDIRYSEGSLTEANWDAATRVQGGPMPGEGGAQESFTITGLNAGATYYVGVKTCSEAGIATSPLSNVVSATTTASGNHAPVLQPIGNQSVTENATLTFAVSATDADGDPLTYSARNVPAGANFDPATRTFTWTPTTAQRGTCPVTFLVGDGYVKTSQSVSIVVTEYVAPPNRPPVLAAVGDQNVEENASLSFSLSASDPDGDSLTSTATDLPTGASFENGTFSWSPSRGQAGSYQVTFSVSDGKLTASQQVTITVVRPADRMPPYVHDSYPSADAVQAPVNPLIAFTISDAGWGIDASTVNIEIDGKVVYSGDRAVEETAYGACRRTGTPESFRYYYQPALAFNLDQEVPICVSASDLAGNVMTPVSYQFSTEMQLFGQNQPVGSTGASVGHPAIATDSQGNIWAAWHAGRANARDIYVAMRNSQTRQWEAPRQLTNVYSDQCNPAIAVGADGAVYVAWQDNRRINWDVYASARSSKGVWREARLTTSARNEINPAIAIDQASPSHVYIAWEDDRAGNRDIYIASLTTSFTGAKTMRVTSDRANQTGPVLAVGSDNTVYLVWTDQRKGSADVYGSSSRASAWANVPIAAGPGNQRDPAIAVEPGSSLLHVLWADDAAGNSDIFYGTSNGLPTSPIAGTTIIDDSTAADQLAPAIAIAKDHQNVNRIYACWLDNRSMANSADNDLYFAEIRSDAGRTNVFVGDDGTNSGQRELALGFDEYGQPVVLWSDSRGNTTRIYSASSTYPKPVPLASALISGSAGGRVGQDPASIDDATDVSVAIPPNAYRGDILFSISQMQNPPKFRSACIAGYEIGPSGVQLSVPVKVVIPYMTSTSAQAVPYWYDPVTGSLSNEGVTEATNKAPANGISVVSFKTTHLTTFYVLENSISSGDGGS